MQDEDTNSLSDNGTYYRALYQKKTWKRSRKGSSRRLSLPSSASRLKGSAYKGKPIPEVEDEEDDDKLEVIGFCDCEEYDLEKLVAIVRTEESKNMGIPRTQSDPGISEKQTPVSQTPSVKPEQNGKLDQSYHEMSEKSDLLQNDRKKIRIRNKAPISTYKTFEMTRPETDDEDLEESHMAKIKNLWRRRARGVGLDDGMKVVKRYTDCVHLRIAKEGRSDTKEDQTEDKVGEVGMADVFVVAWGVVVLWNTSEEATANVRRMIRPCQVARIKNVEEIGTEDMDYVFGLRRGVRNDVITLSADKSGEPAVYEKLAATLALAQSLKLDVLETRIEQQIDDVKHLPKELARKGQITSLSRKQVEMLMGQLFITHTDLTLTSDLLDTPQFFWEEDTELPFYKLMVGYLEIPKRTATLNKRKDVLHELYEIIRDSKESQQATRLEWIIIWLILVEVILELASIVVNYFQYSNNY
mmetsp:Transcript_21708/g.53146  ORF Transcript_21708/g.53146 Transcript_21708/m.53146 type:complete len:470 (+) Transcript_21708:80-1489(+)